MIPRECLDEHLAIVGRTGSGKSYAAKGFVEQLLDANSRVCVMDPTGAWWGLRSNAAGDGPGYQVAVFGGDHGDLPIAEDQAEALAEIIAKSNLPSVIDLSRFTTSPRRRFATRFLDALYHHNRNALHLIMDEADEFGPQRPGPDQTTLLNRLDQIVRRGRVKGFRVMMITQRPAVLNKDVLSQASTLIAMKLTAPQDRNALAAWIEGQADRDVGKKMISSLPGLNRGQGYVWWPEGDLLELMTFPPITTFDSSRTPEAGETVMLPTGLAEVDLSDFRAALAVDEPAKKGAGSSAVDIEVIRAQAFLQGFAAGRRDIIDGMAPAVKALIDLGSLGDVIDVRPELIPARVAPSYQGPDIAKLIEQSGDATIPKGQRRILNAVAWLEVAGIAPATRLQVGWLSDYSPSSGNFGNLLGSMRTAGLIEYPKANHISLTETGRASADRPAIPPTTADLHAAIHRHLGGSEWRILSVAIAFYPAELSRDRLAEQAGYSAISGNFGNLLGRLRSLGFIDYPSKGMVRAESILFLKGAS